jgi:sugar fermentation stimulation protein A
VRFERPLIEGTLLRRNRFLADVKLRNGDEIQVHCAHAGSMKSCSDPGSKVLVSLRDDPRLKVKHQLEIIYAGRTPVGIHTGRPTMVVTEAITNGRIPELAGYATLRRDAPNGKQGRADFALAGNGLRPCYVQVKSITCAFDGVAFFPDATSTGESERLAELTDLVREGNRAMVLLVVQRADVNGFKPADHIDPDFGQAFRDAVARGVEVVCYRADITRKGIELGEKIDIDLGS